MSARLVVIIVVALLLIIVGFGTFFTVAQTSQAIVLRFSEPKRIIKEPGLQIKWPLIDTVVEYDNRILDFDPPQEEVIAADTKRLVVDSYARFRIADPLLFLQAAQTEDNARGQLGAMISATLRRVIGSVDLAAVISTKRAEIMRNIRDEVREQAKQLGIDVIDVRLRRADLPEGNSQAIYDRMKSERQREAAQFRAQGAQQGQQIRANADRQRIEIRADADKQAQIARGQGDADSIRILADAFGKDKDFFAFYRSLQAYREAMANPETTLVLAPDSEFFRYFGSAPHAAAQR